MRYPRSTLVTSIAAAVSVLALLPATANVFADDVVKTRNVIAAPAKNIVLRSVAATTVAKPLRPEDPPLSYNEQEIALQKSLGAAGVLGRDASTILIFGKNGRIQYATPRPSSLPSALPVPLQTLPPTSSPSGVPATATPAPIVTRTNIGSPAKMITVPERAAILQVPVRANEPLPQAPSHPRTLRQERVFDGNTESVFAPPDTQIAVGPGAIAQINNGFLRVWSRAGVDVMYPPVDYQLRGDQSSAGSGLVPVDAGVDVFDPWIVYDVQTRRWFASAIISRDPRPQDSASQTQAPSSALAVAVSDVDNPSHWNVRTMLDMTGVLHDQPKLAVTADKVAIAWTDFGEPGDVFQGGSWAVFDKGSLTSAGSTASGIQSDSPDRCIVAPIPARVLDNSSTLYILATVVADPSCNAGTVRPTLQHSGNDLRVFRIDGEILSLSTTQFDFAVTPYSAPPNVSQSSPGLQLNLGDNRLLSAVVQHNRLWAAANEACQSGNAETGARGCFRLFGVTTESGVPALASDQSISYSDRHLMYPSLTIDRDDSVFAVVSETDVKGGYLGGAVFAQLVNRNDWGLLTFAHAKADAICPLSRGAIRIGDYHGADRDPGFPDRVWFAVQVGATQLNPNGPCEPTSAVARFSYQR